MTVTKQDVEDRLCASLGDMEQSDRSLRARIHEIMSPAIRAAATGAATENIPNLAAFAVAQEDRTYVESESILLTAQSPGTQNGVYTVGTVGGGLAALTRRSDLNESAEFEQGMQVPVLFGSGAGDWRLTTANPITLGSTSLTFTRASASGQELRDRTGETLSPETQIEVFGAKISKTGGRNRIDLGRVDVTEYGAVGDGVTNCDAAFQAALAALHIPTSAPELLTGGELFIPKGIYRLTKQLQGPRTGGAVPRNIVIRGAARGNCVLQFDFTGSSNVGDGIVIEHDTVTNSGLFVTIEELTIENRSPTNRTGNSATTLAQSSGPASPNITLSGYPYNTSFAIRVEILTTGASGTATYRCSRDGGATWTASDLVTGTAARNLPGIGAYVAFPAGTYQDGAIYDWTVTGFMGAGVRMTGGAYADIRRCEIVGWARGVICDGALDLTIENCIINAGYFPGTFGVPYQATMSVWFTDNSYHFPVGGSTNNHCIRKSSLGTWIGVWHEGGVRQNVTQVEFTDAHICGLFDHPFTVEWSQAYFEAVSQNNEDSMLEFSGGAAVTNNFTLRNSFVANQYQAPLITVYFPATLSTCTIVDNFITGSPQGSGFHTGQTSLIVGGGAIQSLVFTGNTPILSGASTLIDVQPSHCAIVGDTVNRAFGVHTASPAAALHVRCTTGAIDMLRVDRPENNKARLSLSGDGSTLLHGTQYSADNVNYHGHSEKCVSTTTTAGGSTVSVTNTIPLEMCSHTEVTAVVRPYDNEDTFSSWRFRIQAKRFTAGNATYNGTDDDAIMLSRASVASAQSYTDSVRMMGNPQLVFAEVGGTGDTITRSGGADAGSFLKDGFRSGMFITSSGTASNNFSRALATTITDTVITLDTQDLLDAGETITGSVITGGGLDGVIGNRVSPYGRRVLITTGGATPSDAPASATIIGTDIKGMWQTETITVAQTATTAIGLKYFTSVSQINLPAGDGTGATLKFGYDGVLLLDTEIDPSDTGHATPIVRIHSGGGSIECLLSNGTATFDGRWQVRFDNDQRSYGGES